MAAYAALVSLMHIIDDLELHPRPPISLHKNQVHLLTQKITFLQEFLEGYHLGYTTEADPLETRIADAAYAAEDVIENHIVDQITNDGENISSDDSLYESLEKVIEEMALIEKEAMQIKLETLGFQHQLHTESKPLDSSKSFSSIAEKRSMVGADDVLFQLKDKLTSHCHDLQIIPVVGMGGSGKTTLALNIYQDRLIKRIFNICAWVTISQEYNIREILIQILGQLNEVVGQDLRENLLAQKLHQHLYHRKFLIVLDDMWSIDAWEGVMNYFPNNKNGSRIIITTRLSNLTSRLPTSDILEMKLLDEAHSWELLSKTVFREKGCPLEFEEIGMNIGKSCKGLPLSIVVVGGLLAKSTHIREFWEYIKQNLNSIVNLEDNERCLKILYMSYKQLPVHLKPCFLYMGVFPEDEKIRISKLIKLWVAEGFLKPASKKSMEEIAKEYLEDLIGRNLILIHKLGSIGKIKECKIHDLLRDLCLREAEKEKFYTVVASPPSPQRIVDAAQRRIVVPRFITKDEAINALSSMPLARSLIWNILGNNKLPPLNLMRLLRILDSSSPFSDTTETCLESMYQLVNSRYIFFPGFRCRLSIGRFWNLQTLYCRPYQFRGAIFIWDMIQIRHIQFNYLMELDNDQYQDKLEYFTCGFVSETESDEVQSGSVSLERLINFPNSLIKLALQVNKGHCWQDILDKIGALPLLQKLKLGVGNFKGQWETTEGHFCSLKFLSLDECQDLQVWTTECSHFPCLEHLFLDGIYELEEIPSDFAEISTLRRIDVHKCSDSVVESAKRIVEEREELYGEEAALQLSFRDAKFWQ